MKKQLLTLALLLIPVLACNAAGAQQPIPVATAQVSEQRPAQKSAGERLLELRIPQLLALMLVLNLVSEAAIGKAAAGGRAIKNAWNWALLLSLLVCVVLGFTLLFPLEKAVKGWVFRWHIWSGVVCAWAGIYHALKRVRAMC